MIGYFCLLVSNQVSTLDGVLEVRNEHFWTVGFGRLVSDRGRRRNSGLTYPVNRGVGSLALESVKPNKENVSWAEPECSSADS